MYATGPYEACLDYMAGEGAKAVKYSAFFYRLSRTDFSVQQKLRNFQKTNNISEMKTIKVRETSKNRI